MKTIVRQLRSANKEYAATFEKGDLPHQPARHFAVVTCMDARFIPAKVLGFEEGDAHVIRNAGGLVTDDALRSLILSHWLLGTREAVVVAHVDCGMLAFTNADLHQQLAELTGHDASHLDFQPFSDLDESVRTSVRRIRDCPFLPDSFAATGFVYDVRSGTIREAT